MATPADVGLTLGASPDPGRAVRQVVVGQGVRVTVTAFDRASGAAVAEADPTLTIYPPGEAPVSVSTAALTPVSPGAWFFDVDATTAGTWLIYAACTTPRDAAADTTFDALPIPTSIAGAALTGTAIWQSGDPIMSGSADIPDVRLSLTADAPAGTAVRQAMLGQGVRVTVRAIDAATRAPVPTADPALRVFPPVTEADPTPAPLLLPTSLLTEAGPGVWFADVEANAAGAWVVYAAATTPRAAAAQIAFVVASVAGVVPAASAPMLTTQDLWPILTESGGILTATRVPALPPADGLAGVVLIGVQDGKSVNVPGGFIPRYRSFSIFIPDEPATTKPVAAFIVDVPVTFAAGLAGCLAEVGTPPTADTVWTLRGGGVPFGAVTFAAGTGAPSFAAAAARACPVGTLIDLLPPASADPTAADFAFTLQAALD
jgi:hypothetical protein